MGWTVFDEAELGPAMTRAGTQANNKNRAILAIMGIS
jgi:hypothetical protein